MSSIPLADAAAAGTAVARRTHRDPARCSCSSCWLAPSPRSSSPATRTRTRSCRSRAAATRSSSLDLSASISTDTYSQIGATLSGSRAQQRQARARPLLGPGVRGAARRARRQPTSRPLVRLFTLPKETQAGFAPTLPPNPWTASFSGGTKISAGLTLAHTLAVASRGRRPTVVLVSDLSDDPRDVTRLASILLAYRRDGIPVRIVGLESRARRRRAVPPLAHARARGRPRAGRGRARAAHPHAFPWPLVALRARSRAARSRCDAALVAPPRVGRDVTSRLLAAAALIALAVLVAAARGRRALVAARRSRR